MVEERRIGFQVIDEKGVRGTLDLTVVPPEGSESKLVLVRFDDGSQIFVDASTFVEKEQGLFFFPGSLAELFASEQTPIYGQVPFGKSGQIVIPLLAEEIKIAREKFVTGGVRVRKTVVERVETIDEPTFQEEVTVERIPVNSFVGEPPAVRYEGETMIVPVLKEVLVVEKKLVLYEEIRITKKYSTSRNPQNIVVRREEATLEKIAPEQNPNDAPAKQ